MEEHNALEKETVAFLCAEKHIEAFRVLGGRVIFDDRSEVYGDGRWVLVTIGMVSEDGANKFGGSVIVRLNGDDVVEPGRQRKNLADLMAQVYLAAFEAREQAAEVIRHGDTLAGWKKRALDLEKRLHEVESLLTVAMMPRRDEKR